MNETNSAAAPRRRTAQDGCACLTRDRASAPRKPVGAPRRPSPARKPWPRVPGRRSSRTPAPSCKGCRRRSSSFDGTPCSTPGPGRRAPKSFRYRSPSRRHAAYHDSSSSAAKLLRLVAPQLLQQPRRLLLLAPPQFRPRQQHLGRHALRLHREGQVGQVLGPVERFQVDLAEVEQGAAPCSGSRPGRSRAAPGRDGRGTTRASPKRSSWSLRTSRSRSFALYSSAARRSAGPPGRRPSAGTARPGSAGSRRRCAPTRCRAGSSRWPCRSPRRTAPRRRGS